ncbi:MAG: hypothetical protein HC915_17800 [Anaerolineae bacterium]|nr:hypothetical protein [Anaerolineae bacterium]
MSSDIPSLINECDALTFKLGEAADRARIRRVRHGLRRLQQEHTHLQNELTQARARCESLQTQVMQLAQESPSRPAEEPWENVLFIFDDEDDDEGFEAFWSLMSS